jgi:mannitol/fructose-specific phosphotransferase system IIA component
LLFSSFLSDEKRATHKTTGIMPVQVSTGIEIASGSIIALITMITTEMTEIAKQTASIFLVFDIFIPPFQFAYSK